MYYQPFHPMHRTRELTMVWSRERKYNKINKNSPYSCVSSHDLVVAGGCRTYFFSLITGKVYVACNGSPIERTVPFSYSFGGSCQTEEVHLFDGGSFRKAVFASLSAALCWSGLSFQKEILYQWIKASFYY